MKTTILLTTLSCLTSIVLAAPAEAETHMLQKRIGTCGKICSGTYAVSSATYSLITGAKEGGTVQITDGSINTIKDHKSGVTSNICGSYVGGYTVTCSSSGSAESLTTSSGKKVSCTAKTSLACEANTGLEQIYYEVKACCG